KDIDLTLNYSQDHARTMTLKEDNGLKPEDNYLPDNYMKTIDFNHSEILKTKVKHISSNEKEFRITTNIESNLLEQVNYKHIHACVFNNINIIENQIIIVEISNIELMYDLKNT